MWEWIKAHPIEVAVIGVGCIVLLAFIWWQSKAQSNIFNTRLPS